MIIDFCHYSLFTKLKHLRITIIFLCLNLLYNCTVLFGQDFTKVTTGELVTDNATSFGCTWIDYDGDGDLDLFVVNARNENNSLYRNEGGTFKKMTQSEVGSIVSNGGESFAVSWGDYDNDGNQDVFVANFNQSNFLYRNNGDGKFTRITTGLPALDAGNSQGSSWADFNNDGFLDLFVANVNNQNNFLYKNVGDGTFTKIASINVVTDGSGSHGSSWGDYDNDGDSDLFVATNDGSNNLFFENNADETFTQITDSAFVSDAGTSLGASWGDYDNDGDLDLFVTNSLNENNLFYKNNGSGSFEKITSEIITNEGGNSMSSSWADFDNDGDLDLFVANSTLR